MNEPVRCLISEAVNPAVLKRSKKMWTQSEVIDIVQTLCGVFEAAETEGTSRIRVRVYADARTLPVCSDYTQKVL